MMSKTSRFILDQPLNKAMTQGEKGGRPNYKNWNILRSKRAFSKSFFTVFEGLAMIWQKKKKKKIDKKQQTQALK